MKNKSMYKGTAGLMTAAMLLTVLTGCGSTGGSTLSVSLDHSYASEKISIGDLNYADNIYTVGDNILIVGGDEEYKSMAVLYHRTDGTAERVSLQYLDECAEDENMYGYVAAAATDSDGGIKILYCGYSLNDEGDSWEAYSYTMESYDSNMQLTETRDLGNILSEGIYLNTVSMDGNGNYVFAVMDETTNENSILVFDKDLNQTASIAGDFDWMQGMYTSADGSIYLSYYSNTNGNQVLSKVNTETEEIEPLALDGMPTWYNNAFVGTGDYDLYIYDSTSVYGIKVKENTCEEVVNWVNSDFTGDRVRSVYAIPDGGFIVNAYAGSDLTVADSYLLTERSEKDLKNMQLISLAVLYTSEEISDAVCQYNRSQKNYRIVIEDYSKYNTDDDYEAGLNKFESDMTSGVIADIIDTSSIAFESYARKGVFADIGEMMDNDSDFNQDDYFMNYFDSLEYNGSLRRIGYSYTIHTLAAKTSLVGETSGLSTAEFMELVQEMPEGMSLFSSMTKDDALYYLCLANMSNFINTENASCSFNSSEFIDLLTFCNSLSEESLSFSDFDESDWDQYMLEMDSAYLNNKVLMYTAYLYSPDNYHEMVDGYFGGEDVTMVGYPTAKEGSNGGYFSSNSLLSISSSSKYKEEAWDFIKLLLSEDYQTNSLAYTMPVNKNAMKAMMEDSLNPSTYLDENDNEVAYNSVFYMGSEEIDIGIPTQKEMDDLMAYAESITEYNYNNSDIYNIIQEEATMYFDGDQTVEAAADMIQSRVGLYMSEQS
jgi:ABC-type glycerol-3-phosphate transport system substrate-binding protein